MKLTCVILAVLVPLTLGLALQEDDLVFDDVTEETSPPPVLTRHKEHDVKLHKTKKYNKIERFWGIPDAIAVVGQVFKLRIPKQAFSGNIDRYEIHGHNGKPLPHWLLFDDGALTLMGVPSKKDEGQNRFIVKAHGKYGAIAEDNFTIRVVNENYREMKKNPQKRCDESEDQTVMSILLDARFDGLKAIVKVEALEYLGGFMGINPTDLFMFPLANKEKRSVDQSSIIMSGPGNVKHRKPKHFTVIQWQIGCEGHLWKHQEGVVKQIREVAKDGTLSEVLQLPVLLWRVKTETSDLLRNRRETGSGDFGNNDDEKDDYDENYDEDYDSYDDKFEDNESSTEVPRRNVGDNEATKKEPESEHPHRHHHGQESVDIEAEERVNFDEILRASNPHENTINTTSTSSTPKLVTEASEASTTEKPVTPLMQPSSTVPEVSTTEFAASTSSSSPQTTSTTTSTTTEKATTEEATTPSTTTTTTIPSTTTLSTTPPTTTTTTTTTTTETPRTTEDIEVGNLPPRLHQRMQKIVAIEGKPLNIIIPSNTFSDIEDGDTRNLRLKLLLRDKPVDGDHWLQFNERTQKLYGLPLESDISHWEYKLVATDREGLSVSDQLDVYVQQHKSSKSSNHGISIYVAILERSKFPANIDWELRMVQQLARLYGDDDSSHITVRSIRMEGDQATFTWTNDSVSKTSECPKDELDELVNILISGKYPSSLLQEALSPEIQVTRVFAEGQGACENIYHVDTQPPEEKTEKPLEKNLHPVPRNPVDHLSAVVGQLLMYRVPEDSFWDSDDGTARKLKMSLLTMDRREIPEDDWLQFDSKNQEFYGVPMAEDYAGGSRREYQLVVADKEGAEAVDTLVVDIKNPPRLRYIVDFSMTIHTPYETFSKSAMQKRQFIELLQQLFGDRNASTISLTTISPALCTTVKCQKSGKDIDDESTLVNWTNTTLPTDVCPDAEIRRLMKILVKSDKSLTDRVHEVLSPKFPVQQIQISPMGVCVGEMTRVHTPGGVAPGTGSKAVHDNYLYTFIVPPVVIAAMFLLAGIIALILYRRRRSGKMSVSEHDDERQSFRSKGIPVIFQDELEEKPDPGNKSPVILKEEKPPLPPPEYQKSDDGADQPMLPKENSEEPYQPPPPFARTSDNNRQNRPKPTPTYRKPPPYVPP